jgi:RNA polymerase sigma factor (sigma-70 family)
MNSADLLRQFQKTGSEEAFTGVVRLHANLVYSVAKRRLNDPVLAEDVAQTVFARLASSLSKIKTEAQLVVWLHRTTLHVSIDLWRSETRRRAREQQAAAMQLQTTESDHLWDEVSPHVDEALNELNDADREIVLLRFFQRKQMLELGRMLGVSEDAAKMRVSRAIDRLRSQLEKRGIACAATLLAGILAERAANATPANLNTLIQSIRLPNTVPMGFGALFQPRAWNIAAGAVLMGCALLLIVRSHTPVDSTGKIQQTVTQRSNEGTNASIAGKRSALSSLRSSQFSPSPTPRFIVRVTDVNTGQGLPNAQIRAAYFYAGGRGEGHTLVTDGRGEAGIPKPNEGGEPGMNLFVSVNGYVPKAMGFGKTVAPEFIFKAEPAALASGVVVDEQGTPVAGVRLEASRSENYRDGQPNTDFQTVKVETDMNGRWQYHYIPFAYDEAILDLTADGFRISRGVINMRTSESTNATLVIKRGHSVAGRVTDGHGNPVMNAHVKEFHNFGHRTLKTETDVNGQFLLSGIYGFNGTNAEIVVESEHMEPQLKIVELRNLTNTVDFVLRPGNVFRGRVVNDLGEPVPGAAARTDSDNQGRRPFEWFTHTDERGMFLWDAAPAAQVLVWFEADGYMPIRDLPITADGQEHEIKLKRVTQKREQRGEDEE